MKEQDLVDLGFKKENASPDEILLSEFGDNFYYYTYNFVRGLSLITQASDEVVNNEWVVEFFNFNTICFTDKKSVEKLIKTINKAKI
jgi:hypothetical protein